ncbi:uncharacterized protein LOC135842063 [Planococcus citri]|uniref:uncharacterized protein LOC135842063 n=1 Tax=Planococcus citri TaxID=170843 RepID=UPI0031F85405
MKAFCALLLLVAYVSASHHECDPLAADTMKKPGADPAKGDQHIPLDVILSVSRARYTVSQATLSTLANANSYCNAATHGKECDATEYFRALVDGPEPNSEKGADKLRFYTVFVGVNKVKDEAVEYHMSMKGINEDDYIMQATNIPIKAVRVQKDGTRIDIAEKDISPEIVKSLRQPYALFHAKIGSFAVYVTCNGTTIWVSWSLDAIKKGLHKNDPELATVLANLKIRAADMRQKLNIQGPEPEIRDIVTPAIENAHFTQQIPVA